jgi:hypothetical protein
MKTRTYGRAAADQYLAKRQKAATATGQSGSIVNTYTKTTRYGGSLNRVRCHDWGLDRHGARLGIARRESGQLANAISQDDYDNEMLREEDTAIGADRARRQAS